jgi:hypothetical protein
MLLDRSKGPPNGHCERLEGEEYPVVMVRDPEPDQEQAGLCADCRHMRLIKSDRGSTFYLCQRSTSDKSFPKYPRLPVIQCRGYELNPLGESEGD